jgi:hypothetical protein
LRLGGTRCVYIAASRGWGTGEGAIIARLTTDGTTIIKGESIVPIIHPVVVIIRIADIALGIAIIIGLVRI